MRLSRDTHIIALAKGEERYVYVYREGSERRIMNAIGRHASSLDLSLTWYDAAVLSVKIQKNNKRLTHDW